MFSLKSYVLDHSESIDMLIEKLWEKKIFFSVIKNGFFLKWGGGLENYGHVRNY